MISPQARRWVGPTMGAEISWDGDCLAKLLVGEIRRVCWAQRGPRSPDQSYSGQQILRKERMLLKGSTAVNIPNKCVFFFFFFCRLRQRSWWPGGWYVRLMLPWRPYRSGWRRSETGWTECPGRRPTTWSWPHWSTNCSRFVVERLQWCTLVSCLASVVWFLVAGRCPVKDNNHQQGFHPIWGSKTLYPPPLPRFASSPFSLLAAGRTASPDSVWGGGRLWEGEVCLVFSSREREPREGEDKSRAHQELVHHWLGAGSPDRGHGLHLYQPCPSAGQRLSSAADK